MADQHPLQPDHIPDRNHGKRHRVSMTSRRIRRCRTRCALAPAEHVRADREIPVRIESLARTDHVVPPARFAFMIDAGGMRIPRECVRDQDRVRPCRVQFAISFIGNFHGRKRRAGIERDTLEPGALAFNNHLSLPDDGNNVRNNAVGIRWSLRWPALLFLIVTAWASVFGGSVDYREALPGYRYQFPRDHFEHEDFRTEWWYYTGNVSDAAGKRFGFELVFFRQGERNHTGNDIGNKSKWDIRNLYLAHAALTDAAGKHFWYDERLNRAGPGIAGASFERQRIWNGNWSAQFTGDRQTLDAVTGRFRFHLTLQPETCLLYTSPSPRD